MSDRPGTIAAMNTIARIPRPHFPRGARGMQTGPDFALRQARRLAAFLRGEPRPFRSDAQLLNVVGTICAAREAYGRLDDPAQATRLGRLVREARKKMVRALRRPRGGGSLAEAVRRHRLDAVETECLLLLALTGIGRNAAFTLGDLQRELASRGGEAIRVVRALATDGRLVRSRLVCVDEDEDAVFDSRARLHPDLLDRLLRRRPVRSAWWRMRSQAELLGRLHPLLGAIFGVASLLVDGDVPPASRLATAVARRERALDEFDRFLATRPEWSLAQLRRSLGQDEFALLLVLIGQEVGCRGAGFDASSGRALAAAVSEDADDVVRQLRRLGPQGALRRLGLARVCGGEGEVAAIDDRHALATCSFELTQRALRRIGLGAALRKRPGARAPLVRLDQVVLPERVESAVRMALAQAKHADVLFSRWGLGETIRYGRGTTLLFSGPPGVGKTATAEAIAHALGRPILVANVAQLQNCWVGETEKAIVRLFREAAEANAVLFWDEADAFFHEREQATRQWEVREVNVLLQEIERFEGVCILATNRRTALDAALERRVSMKIEFERPDRVAARRIWSKLLPAKLPLGPDVDLDALAAAELTGGQIKNVVLNAARRALLRGPRARVGVADFEEAIRAERDGQWTRKERVGFRD